MRLARRTLLHGAALGLLGLGPLTGCSTSTGGSAAASGELVLWTWPEGFGQAVLDAVKDQFPDLALRQDVIGGDFKQKLTTTLTAGTGLPDITGVKGEDIAFFKQHADYFVDLTTVGGDELKGSYLDWKWAQATTSDGRQLGIPIDIGPTALFYRFDIFQEAGLPYEPDALAAAVTTWEEYIELGKELRAARPDTYLVRSTSGMFDIVWPQSGRGFIDEEGTFIGDQEHIRAAWDTAVAALDAGIVAAVEPSTADSAAAVNEGRLPADFGASWHLADLMADAPETSGAWHVCAHPGAAINYGGSFLCVPAGVKDPEKSLEVIGFLLNDDNQALEYVDKGNFPAATGAFDDERVTGEVEFLGGQRAAEVFAHAAETVRPLYEDPNQATIQAAFVSQIDLVEAEGKDREKAWEDAVAGARRLAEQVGLTV